MTTNLQQLASHYLVPASSHRWLRFPLQTLCSEPGTDRYESYRATSHLRAVGWVAALLRRYRFIVTLGECITAAHGLAEIEIGRPLNADEFALLNGAIRAAWDAKASCPVEVGTPSCVCGRVLITPSLTGNCIRCDCDEVM